MCTEVSRKTLCGSLSLLRQSLAKWQKERQKNVVFLNSAAIFSALSPLPCGTDTVGGILEKIESCIPLALTQKSLSLFLDACETPEKEKAATFLESSKTDFLMLLLYAGNHEDIWESILCLCEELRQKNIQ